jgi:hypothetical protein
VALSNRGAAVLTRTVRWRGLQGPGIEHCTIAETATGITATSVIIGEREGSAYGAFYEARLDSRWLFQFLAVERTDGAGLRLASDGDGHWTRDGAPLPALDGCIDIDLSASPFTNSLPIRRTAFTAGQPVAFRMAWIPFETLQPQPDEQIYTWLGGSTYRYQAADGSFDAELTVDGDGLVLSYPPLFERVDAPPLSSNDYKSGL